MRVVIDIEADGLVNPSNVWLIVCKGIDTGAYHIFREANLNEFLEFAKGVKLWVGHNILGYDFPVLNSLLQFPIPSTEDVLDTLVLSKLVDYSRQGHSIADYGQEFGIPKGDFTDFSKYSKEMEAYCIRDVDICHKIYSKYKRIIEAPSWQPSIQLEQKFQLIANQLEANGFHFNTDKANKLLGKITKELEVLDKEILKAFPPREVLIREFTPKATKYGTINRSSVPRSLHDRIHEYEIGRSYRHTKLEDFNPSSHKQIVQVLSESGWSPTDKTQTHIDTERELNRLKWAKQAKGSLDLASEVAILKGKLESLKRTGWKVNETNLSTLPPDAPTPARLLAKRILLESRRRTLTEWLNLIEPDGRIHGKFYGIGAWTHRMAHQNPNTANIPTEAKLFGGEMRSLWNAPKNRLLVGVDAEGIQLRIFAHYIDDPEFTRALVEGKKDDRTDPHSLNQRILGAKSRNIAKRFIFAYLLGAGIGKLSQILEVDEQEGRDCLDRLLDRYHGLQYLKDTTIPGDARRGYFTGLDGRSVRIPGETPGERKHLCMSGYLQNGEAIVIKRWAIKVQPRILKVDPTALLVNIVHDEKIDECKNNMDTAIEIAKINASGLKEVGEELGLKCPLAGSYWNDDLKDYTIGVNWRQTH